MRGAVRYTVPPGRRNAFYVCTGTPRTVGRCHCVHVPARPPFVSKILVLNECQAEADSVLWGKASDSDVHRLSSDERLPTVHELRKVRTRSERFFLNTKIAVKTALVHPGV